MQPAYNIISLQAETHTQNLKTGLMIEHATSRVKAPTASYFLDLGREGLQSGGVGGSTPPNSPGNSTTAYILYMYTGIYFC